MFNQLNSDPFPLYFAFPAFNELYKLGNQAECSPYSQDGVYTLAAFDGSKKAVLITNISDEDVHISTNLDSCMSVYVVDDSHMLEKADVNPADLVVKKGTFCLICNTLED